LYFWASLKNIFSMALLRLQTVVNPATGASVAGGSGYLVYDTAGINFLTMASKSGSGGAASTFFAYTLPGGGVGQAQVKGSVGAIVSAAGASTVTA
jgi:hypothetical protein